VSGSYSFHLSEIVDPAAPAELWQKLEAGRQASIFTSWQWIGTWLKTLPQQIRPMLLVARQGETELAAAILVVQNTGRIRAFATQRALINATGAPEFDTVTIEHNGFVTQESNPDRLWSEFLNWFGAQDFDELIVPGSSASFPQTGFMVDQEKKTAYRRNDLAELDANGVLPVLSRNARQQISKATRALQDIGDLRISVAANAAEALQYFEAMKALHIRSWSNRKKAHAFRHPYFETFHRCMIESHTKTGGPQMLRISAGERAIGYLYNFFYRGEVFAYQSGFDIDLNEFKPGYVCHVLAIDHYAKLGAKTYDFLAGTNQLKRSLSNEEYTLYWIRARRTNMRNRARSVLDAWLRRGRPTDDRV
jgi:CelD/BcsL family acetyltransferase involved in cellulose biosynthesis